MRYTWFMINCLSGREGEDFHHIWLAKIWILAHNSSDIFRLFFFSDFSIKRFFRLLFCDFSGRFSEFYAILRFFRLSSDSDDFSDSKILLIIKRIYAVKAFCESELEPFKLLFYNMITYNTLWIQCLLYSRFKDYFIFPLAFNRSSISSLCVSITNHMNALNLIQPFVCKCV